MERRNQVRSGKKGSLFCACWNPRHRYSDGWVVSKEFETQDQPEYNEGDTEETETRLVPESETYKDEAKSSELMTVEVEYLIRTIPSYHKCDGEEREASDGEKETDHKEPDEVDVNEPGGVGVKEPEGVEFNESEGFCVKEPEIVEMENAEGVLVNEPEVADVKEPEAKGTVFEEHAEEGEQQVPPRNAGDAYMQNSFDSSSQQDYDVPPSHAGPASEMTAMETYDNPSAVRSNGKQEREEPFVGVYNSPRLDSSRGDDTYDIPRAHLVIKGLDTPHVESNRSSTVSMLSTGSSALSNSARSSMDTSGHDIYDYPPAPKVVTPIGGQPYPDISDIYDTPPSARMLGDPLKLPPKERSSTELPKLCEKEPSYQEISDIPMKLDKGLPLLSDDVVDGGDYIDDYAIPRSDTSRSSGDSGIGTSKCFEQSANRTSDIYDIPPGQRPLPTKASQQDSPKPVVSMSETEAEVAFQRLQLTETGAVYDVPPQVTKDSPSKPSPSKALWDSESCDPEPYEPLRLEVESALEMLAKLQQEVHAAAYRLLSFVSKNWRRMENLHPKLYSIRLACLSVKTSLQEYLEFSQGAAANASGGSPDKRDLSKEINDLIDPLMDGLGKIKVYIKNLESLQWETDKLTVEDEDNSDRSKDDLDLLINVTKKIPLNARTLTLVIQGNAKSLFRVVESPGTPGGPGTPAQPLVSDPRLSMHRSPEHLPPKVTQSPPTKDTTPKDKKPPTAKSGKPPPPPLRPKPKMSMAERSSSMKDRPLPTPPAGNKPPEEPTQPSMTQEPVYNLPKPSERVYNEIPEKPYLEHYDYVHLTKDSEKGLQEKVDASLIVSTEEGDSSSRRSSGADMLEAPRVKGGGLSPKFRARLERLQQDAEKPVQMHTDSSTYDNPSVSRTVQRGQLHENDQLILDFYASQVDTHIEVLHNATDAFLKCVDYNQPPKVFIAHSKFVILAAHKLVYIGDTITRNLLNEDLRNQLMVCGNNLCDCLKATVVGTKNAALNYPSVSVTQEMVDRVVEVSQAANHLRHLITDASATSSD